MVRGIMTVFLVPHPYLLIHRHIEWRQVALTQKPTAIKQMVLILSRLARLRRARRVQSLWHLSPGALGTSSAQLRIGFG
jgi:hypothetical protein